ncbi:MAG TPA: right-handed parallel beta-helix repeat-containing protein, partial [Roseimicrobium sp.]|nr:right-handed parallel beta-helix repeat-containing protein [Roseimicrobium sp.]
MGILLCASLCGVARAVTYEVGSGKALSKIGDVPWESLEAGDVVLIHWRAEPYREKWVICRKGTAAQPIIVRGVPGPNGELPVIDGRDAVTRKQLDYWSGSRSILKIGGAQVPADTMPEHILVERLEIRSGRPPYQFKGRNGPQSYDKNASAIFLEKGEHIVIRGCVFRDCGNGFFSSFQSKDVLVEECRIFDNGIEGSIYEHNSYTAAQGIVFQYNEYGPLRKDCGGNNLKDRSAGLVVRYNSITGGNRQLDLVDAEDSPTLRDDPLYRRTL